MRWIIGCALGAFVAGSVGCAPVAMPEEKGRTQQKQLAPRAMIATKASASTRSAFGISEWRLFRGKSSVYLTGYDGAGKAVKGVSVAFTGSKKGARLRGRIHDGTRYSAYYAYGAKSVSQSPALARGSEAFLKQALSDVGGLRRFVAGASGARTTLDSGCAGDLLAILLDAMQCLQAQGNTPAGQQLCVNAAIAAQQAGQSCQGTGTIDPTGGAGSGGSDPFNPPFDPNDPFGGFDPNNPSGNVDPNNPSGNVDPNDPFGGFDPNNPSGNFDPNDPFGDQSCASCNGAGGDIYGDPYNGDIGYYGDNDGWGG
ncbi:MAG: hypothetical protein KIS78_32865, partial [Labilithrix sp.]|nr:hypothetical protein [Labilithrix sp.]